jgi:hypothetical protein
LGSWGARGEKIPFFYVNALAAGGWKRVLRRG